MAKRVDIQYLNERLIKKDAPQVGEEVEYDEGIANKQNTEIESNFGEAKKNNIELTTGSPSSKKETDEMNVLGDSGAKKTEYNIDLNATDLRNRIEKEDKAVNIFMKNTLPLISENIANSLESISQSNPSAESALSTVSTLFEATMKAKYLTPSEIAMYLGSNFYTLHFIRGITVKKFTGFFGTPWNGYPDITFGRQYADILPSISDVLGELQRATVELLRRPDGDNREIEDAKRRISPWYSENAEWISRQPQGTDPLAPNNRRELSKLEEQNTVFYPAPEKSTTGKWSVEDVRGDTIYEQWDGKRRKHSTNDDDYVVNRDVINITLPDGSRGSKNDIAGERPGLESIGYLLVMPQDRGGEFENFYIPFEFNPSISKGGVSTQYNAQQILSRIGALQTFSNVELSTVDIEAEYLATSNGDLDNRGSVGHDWMSEYTLSHIQGIQRAYESLSLPTFPSDEQENIEKGFKYIKPPLIKVIIGDAKEDEEQPYSQLLTYPRTIGDGILSSHKNRKYYRTFIVTSVNIQKDLQQTPLYIGENKKVKDTFGFTVSISLAEVSKSYMDAMPNFRSYFSEYEQVVGDRIYGRG